MKKQVLPVMAFSWEALAGAAEEAPPVIYVDRPLYNQCPGRIREVLGQNGYVLSVRTGKRGVFFLLTRGPSRFCPDTQEIHDPLHIL